MRFIRRNWSKQFCNMRWQLLRIIRNNYCVLWMQWVRASHNAARLKWNKPALSVIQLATPLSLEYTYSSLCIWWKCVCMVSALSCLYDGTLRLSIVVVIAQNLVFCALQRKEATEKLHPLTDSADIRRCVSTALSMYQHSRYLCSLCLHLYYMN